MCFGGILDYIAPTLDEVRGALQFVSPVCDRDDWAAIAMSLKSEFGDSAFDLFDQWSQGSDQYKLAAVKSTWRSVSSYGGVTIRSLFSRAIAGGFVSAKTEPSEEDLASRKAEDARRKRAAMARDEKERALLSARNVNCAAVCQALLSHCTDEGASPYFKKKQVLGYGVRFPKYQLMIEYWEATGIFKLHTDGDYISRRLKQKTEESTFRYIKKGVVVVPLVDEVGSVRNVQLLFVDSKSFLPGPKSGLFHIIGSPRDGDRILIGEGYATLASCHMAAGFACVVALDAGNLPKVAKSIRTMFPRSPILIAGDDDVDAENNVGRLKALEAARLVQGATVFPDFDLAVSHA